MRLNKHENTPKDYERSRQLRNEASPHEKKLWFVLRDLAAQRGLKFRRQQVVHPFIADFACMQARLLVELDGSSHDARQDYDKSRDEFLRQNGFTILRFSNQEAAENPEGVAEMIVACALALLRDCGVSA